MVGSGVDNILNGNPVFSIDAEMGRTVLVDGTDDTIRADIDRSSIASHTFTLSFWFRPLSVVTATEGIFSWSADASPVSGSTFILIQSNSGNLRFYCDNGYREATQTLVANTLYHAAVTRQAGINQWAFYLDGKQLSTYTDDGTPSYNLNADEMYFGSGFNGYINAHFGDMRYHDNIALLPVEIYHQYAPETRWDLYLPAAPRFWSVPAAAPPAGVAMPIFGNDDQLFGSIFGGAIVR